MAASSVVAFWAVAFLLIMVPGADWAFTISATVGGRTALPAVGGLVAGYAVITAVVAAGAGALVAGTPAFLTGLTIAGGLYLIYLGIRTTARPPAQGSAAGASAHSVPAAASSRAVLVRGFGVSALNPKGLLLFLAVLPQFADPHRGWPFPAQLGLLGAVFMATCGLFYFCLGSFARKVLTRRPAAARLVSRISGIAMIVIGVVLLADR